MPFLEKLADITVSGRHVGDMSATFPAKRRATERILVVEIKIKLKSKPYIQVICLCLNLSDGESLANFLLRSSTLN
jgi:hypothetical protein